MPVASIPNAGSVEYSSVTASLAFSSVREEFASCHRCRALVIMKGPRGSICRIGTQLFERRSASFRGNGLSKFSDLPRLEDLEVQGDELNFMPSAHHFVMKPMPRGKFSGFVSVKGARQHNLKDVDVEI